MAAWKCRAAPAASPLSRACAPSSFSRNAWIAWWRACRLGPRDLREPLADRRRLVPLMLILVEPLELQQRVLVLRIEPQHFGERLDGAIDEAAAPVVEAEAEQHVGVLEAAEPRALQQLLMDLDGAPDLTLLAVQVAENHVDLERVRREPRRLAELLDREIELVADEEVEPLHVVRRLARLAAIDPAAFLQLVALPRLAGGEPEQERDQRGEERSVRRVHHREPPPAKRGDERRPAALRAQHVLDQLARRAVAAAPAADPVDALEHVGHRVARRATTGRPAQHRQVEHVVAHVGDVGVGQVVLLRGVRRTPRSLSSAP